MLVLRKLKWSNWFSYGDNNSLDLDSAALTQLLGTNGAGKSSIPLILEELLYGKNSKGIKKADIPNRFSDSNTMTASLEFSTEDGEYKVELVRKSTVKLSLYKDGIDISSHTSRDTYKEVENIIGMDFKTFTQLVYQSSKSSLEFLTSTDSARKAFLISLLNLEEYTAYGELFKEQHKRASNELLSLTGSKNSINKWLETNGKYDVAKKERLKVPDALPDDEIVKLKVDISNISTKNKAIRTNNENITKLENLGEVQRPPEETHRNSTDIQLEIRDLKAKAKNVKAKVSKVESLGTRCHSCGQDVPQTHVDGIIDKLKTSYREAASKIKALELESSAASTYEAAVKSYNTYKTTLKSLKGKIDETLPTKEILAVDLNNKLYALEADKRAVDEERERILAENTAIDAFNAKVDYTVENIAKQKEELANLDTRQKELEKELNTLAILKKSFGTNGLVAYKLEYLVNGLSDTINQFLAELSDGRFQLEFNMSGDKLNVEVYDNGTKVHILALSSGELARVNTATLLAIRSIMASVSKTKLNLLFLDEVMGVLDDEGKEKLIEVLLEQKDLNTFIVSHEYTHPLLEKVEVVKEDKFSEVRSG